MSIYLISQTAIDYGAATETVCCKKGDRNMMAGWTLFLACSEQDGLTVQRSIRIKLITKGQNELHDPRWMRVEEKPTYDNAIHGIAETSWFPVPVNLTTSFNDILHPWV